MNRVRLILLVVAFAASGGLLGTLLYLRFQPPDAYSAADARFRLVDQEGRAFTQKDLRGRPTAMFFGFTFCPEVCPTTLTELSVALEALGDDADRLNVVFVSVDPERDTPAQLKTYLSNFDRRIRGVSGAADQVEAIAMAYRALYLKVPTEYGYTMDHTADILLLDRKGEIVERLRYGLGPEEVEAGLRDLLDPPTNGVKP
ncbi:MAG: SCO family protein [Phenylobacterium sp.]|nr:SCO family protein [Phenylobacterium sp.]